MWIFLEWCLGIILFFLGIGQFNDNSYYDECLNTYEMELGALYILGAFVVFVIAYAHTSMFDDDYYFDNSRSYNNTYNHNNSSWGGTITNVVHYPQVTAKTQTEVISDITINYPKSITSINQITEHKIKKPSLFSFKKEYDVVTSVINMPQKSNKEADLIAFNKEEERDIKNALLVAAQNYVCYEDLGEIRTSIIHAEYDSDNNVNIFFKPSSNVNIKANLNKYCITEEMKKHLGYCEDIRFVETKENFEDFYLEWKRTI